MRQIFPGYTWNIQMIWGICMATVLNFTGPYNWQINALGIYGRPYSYRQQHFNEEWLIIITTDHGRDAATGKGHGGQSDRERASWIFTNAKNLNAQFHTPLSSVTDIMPSIARFMQINIARDQAFETDGIPFLGPLSFIHPQLQYNKDSLFIQWKAIAKTGPLKVWITSTNHFKTGGKDDYTLWKTIPLAAQKIKLGLSGKPAGWYKIVLEAAADTSNYGIENKIAGWLKITAGSD